MTALDLLIYEATRITEKGSPGLYQITSEHTFHRFEPIPNEDHRWGDGLFRAWVRGGTEPSYRVRIPAGEMFDKEVGSGIVRTFLRIPGGKKGLVLDGCEILFALRFGEHGFEQLPLVGGRTIEREEKPSPAVQVASASKLPPLQPGLNLPVTPTRVVSASPVALSEAPPTRIARIPALDRPIPAHSGRTAQASLFGEALA